MKLLHNSILCTRGGKTTGKFCFCFFYLENSCSANNQSEEGREERSQDLYEHGDVIENVGKQSGSWKKRGNNHKAKEKNWSRGAFFFCCLPPFFSLRVQSTPEKTNEGHFRRGEYLKNFDGPKGRSSILPLLPGEEDSSKHSSPICRRKTHVCKKFRMQIKKNTVLIYGVS